MAAAHHQPPEIDEVVDQHHRHDGGDADQGDGNPVGRAFGRRIGRFLFHAADGDADA